MDAQRLIVGFWPILLLGWPAVALALAAWTIGIVRKRTWMACVGAALAAPFCFYIGMHSAWAGAAVLVSNVLSAWMVHRGRRAVAVVLLLPFAILIFVVLTAVVRSN